jgi:hypothetical protein
MIEKLFSASVSSSILPASIRASVSLQPRPTGKDNHGTWSVSTEIALKKLKAWKVINGEGPVALDFYDDDPRALSTT